MTKRERLEDLGKLSMMLKDIVENEIFENTDSKHCFEQWKKQNYDKEEYGEIRGLDHIFCSIRNIGDQIQECYCIALGEDL